MGAAGNLFGVLDGLVERFKGLDRSPPLSSVRELCAEEIKKANRALAEGNLKEAEKEIAEIKISLQQLARGEK